ncbi:MAG TPA: T9SS type A sorting domain-containing protein, partial [Bacteroidetes bacterium]|nr:T9SS type A sorting domain-containing protein [Bacteroidota bacterium]
GGIGQLSYCFVGYGGGEFSANIHANRNAVKIDNCTISYSNERGIWIGDASPDINNCTFNNNKTQAVWIEGFDSLKTFTFTNNTFKNNAWAVYANLSEDSNDIFLSGNTSTGADANGFGRNGFGMAGTISGKVKYTGQRNFPFIIWDDVTVKENASLDISAGTTVKFNDYWDGINVYGSLIADAEYNNPIVFAALSSDCFGGDTAGDLDTIPTNPGEWSGIYFDTLSNHNLLKNCIITSGGGEGGAMIHTKSKDLLIDSCMIFNSAYHGILIGDNSPVITNNIISDNKIGIYVYGGANPLIHGNTFNKNEIFGVQNVDGNVVVDARNNFWGSSTGPFNANTNPDGLGNAVSDFVDYDPWLTNSQIDLTGHKPDFDFVVNGNKVSFINLSQTGGQFVWDLGDMSNDIVNNPFHVYEKPGDYHVCLESLGSGCFPTESVCKKISIKGISSFLPKEAGNIGLVTMDIAAGAINNNTQFFIRDNSGQISAEEVYIYQNGTAKVIFDLSGVSTGQKDLVIQYEDGTILSADTKLNVVNGYEAEPSLEIIARGAALINVWTKYEIKVTNPGNVDMFGVPVWIAFSEVPGIEARFTNVEFTTSPYEISKGYDKKFYEDNNIDVFIVVDSIFGQADHSRVYPLYLPLIPAGQSISLKMEIKSPEDFDFQAWVNDPYFSNDLTRGPSFNGRLLGCLGSIFVDKLIEVVPGVDCANTVIKSIYKPFSPLQSNSPKVFVWPSGWDYVSIGLDCGKSVFASVKMAYEITKLVVNLRNDIAAIRDCQKNFDPKKKKKKPIDIVHSFDPNEKEGPSGYGSDNYLSYQDNLTYTIYFENDPDSAQVPAHTVLVVDSFDMSVFDINSFQINGVTVGDNLVNGLPGAKTFAANINLSDLNVDARVTVDLDTILGVMQCKFYSLDPDTGNEIEDPFSGFLPPNINKPEGEGNVTFTIGLKKYIYDGLTVRNKAAIYFDANKPINTNNFINTFDLSNPESNITSVESLNNGNAIVNISGEDSLSGIDYYEIWASENDGSYKIIDITKNTVDTISGTTGSHYKLYSIAVDNVGNKEEYSGNPDVEFVMTSTYNISLDKYFSIYPNPAQDYITLTIDLKNSENVSLDIYNQLGERIENIFYGNLYNGIWQKQLNIDNLESGLYFINCKIGNKKITRKLIIQ